MNKQGTIAVAALLALGLACGGSARDPADGGVAAPPVEHAPAGAEPGTHADWCGEHQVPESQCTRCNPSLIAAFKATGDWCREHGLPESQCTVCNPELRIERPPAEGLE